MVKTTDILGLQFETYPLEGTNFYDVPGVYVITTSQKWIDVGETDKLGTRLANHERRPCWNNNSDKQTLWVNFRKIENQQTRLDLETTLRRSLKPVCGDK